MSIIRWKQPLHLLVFVWCNSHVTCQSWWSDQKNAVDAGGWRNFYCAVCAQTNHNNAHRSCFPYQRKLCCSISFPQVSCPLSQSRSRLWHDPGETELIPLLTLTLIATESERPSFNYRDGCLSWFFLSVCQIYLNNLVDNLFLFNSESVVISWCFFAAVNLCKGHDYRLCLELLCWPRTCRITNL